MEIFCLFYFILFYFILFYFILFYFPKKSTTASEISESSVNLMKLQPVLLTKGSCKKIQRSYHFMLYAFYATDVSSF